MKFTLEIILLAFSFLYLIYSVVFVVKYRNRIAETIFHVLLLLFSFDVFVIQYVEVGLWVLYPSLLFTNWTFPFLYGPMFYMFVLLKFTPQKIKLYHIVLFLPFLFMFIASVPVIISQPSDKLETFQQMRKFNFNYLTNDKEWIFHSVWNFVFIVISIYTLKQFKTHGERFTQILFYVLISLLTLSVLQFFYLIIYFKTDVMYSQNRLFLITFWLILVTFRFLVLKDIRTSSNKL